MVESTHSFLQAEAREATSLDSTEPISEASQSHPVVKRKWKAKTGAVPLTLENDVSNSEQILLRVKRRRDEEALEEMELQFAMDGSLKRRKLITHSQALVNRFNNVVNLDSKRDKPSQVQQLKTDVSSSQGAESKGDGSGSDLKFAFGVQSVKGEPEKTRQSDKKRVITLRKLMDVGGKFSSTVDEEIEDKVKAFHQGLVKQFEADRKLKREQEIATKRNIPQTSKTGSSKGESTYLECLEYQVQTTNQKIKTIKQKQDPPEGMKIVDLQELINDDQKHHMQDDSTDIVYDYFLCERKGNFICEPFKGEEDNHGLGMIIDDASGQFGIGEEDDDPEHDSEDSNREDADQNDYPDENSEDDRDDDDCRMAQKSDDSDEEAAARRYNSKMQAKAVRHTQWLDKILRKQKGGVTNARTMVEKLNSNARQVHTESDDEGYGYEAYQGDSSGDEGGFHRKYNDFAMDAGDEY